MKVATNKAFPDTENITHLAVFNVISLAPPHNLNWYRTKWGGETKVNRNCSGMTTLNLKIINKVIKLPSVFMLTLQ